MPVTQATLDRLWDFDDPEGSERRFRDAAAAASDRVTEAELRTQVARALCLQGRHEEAEELLVEIETDRDAVVRIRAELELGRVSLAAEEPELAVVHLLAAIAEARDAGETFLLVDALRMLTIADPEDAEHWAGLGFAALEGVTDERTLRWLATLHADLGWALVEADDAAAALPEFEAALEAARRYGVAEDVRRAEESVEECRRLLPEG